MATTTALRAADLLTLPDPPEGGYYELSEGKLITVPPNRYRHEYVKSNIAQLLILHDPQEIYGQVWIASLFRLADDVARQPDVAFVTHDRLRGIPIDDSIISFIPDIAVEVISKSEYAADAQRKVQEYLAAGVSEVWQVYPEARVVHIRTVDGIRELRSGDVLETPIIPGLSVRVDVFFE